MNDKKLDFAIAIHCHQPVGNFDEVIEEAYQKSYLPFIKSLKNHPKLKLTLHYSGSLLDWIKIHKPSFLKMLKNLARRGQIEFMSGGYYEPILSLIPDVDKLAQIKMLSDSINKNFSQKPQGCWLAERVWEPYFIKILAQAGIIYTVVDDTHFKKALGQEGEIYNYYISDAEGKMLFIFPGSEKLRYLLPFKLPGESIEYLRQAKTAGAGCVSFADDGEKFGFWPETYKWVYKEKWLEKFLTALEENSSWLNTVTLSQAIKNHKPAGRVYLPSASYREMLEWSGGYFNNFLVKYPEANWMQKRMVQLSQELNQLNPRNRLLEKAKRHLYMAQCNCAYWHGIFGGLYLGHLRHSIFSNLIEAEKLKEKITRKKSLLKRKVLDIDKDGNNEILLKNSLLNVFIAPCQNGAILELDYKPKSLNLSNNLSRRKGSYQQKLLKLANSPDHPINDKLPKSIHGLALLKEKDLKNDLVFDRYPKTSLVEHFLDRKVSALDFSRGSYAQQEFINRTFDYKIKLLKDEIALNLNCDDLGPDRNIKLNKEIKIFRNKAHLQINYCLQNRQNRPLSIHFGVEFNFYLHNQRFSSPGSLENIDSWDFQDEWYGVRVKYQLNQPADLIYFPVETISDSESGIEKNYQGLSQIFFWPVVLGSKQTATIEIILNLSH